MTSYHRDLILTSGCLGGAIGFLVGMLIQALSIWSRK
jgi:hypothetical protein